MPKTIRVVSPKNIKPKPPVAWTISIFLLLDHFNAAQWVWGCVGGFVIMVWMIVIGVLIYFKYEEVDLFEDEKEDDYKRKIRTWSEHLEEMEKKYKP